MTTAPSIQWRKEFRELLPWWGATVAFMAVCWALMNPDAMPVDSIYRWAILRDRNFLLGAGVCAYAVGAVVLGAIAIGNEYSHNTLTQLLAQPAARAQVLRVKLVVLAAMLASLGALALWAWGSEAGRVGITRDSDRFVVAAVPLACGLLLAPWFTMLGRSSLSGAVFTAVLPSFLWMAGVYLRLPQPVLWIAAAALALAGATMTWRMFLRLEVGGGSQSDLDLSDWFSRSNGQVRVARTQNPVWHLVKKELRLQQITFLVSGAYVITWLLINMGRRLAPDVVPESALYLIEFLQGGIVPVMLGALACAEERRLGAADWQGLLPFAAWKQWTIKAGLVILLAVALTFVLPEILQTVAVDANLRLDYEPTTAIALCVIALYISSLTSSGLRALLVTYPAIGVAVVLGLGVMNVLGDVAEPAIQWLARAVQEGLQLDHNNRIVWLAMGGNWVAIGFMLLLLRFAYTNHRTAERSSRRTGRQIGWLTTYGVAAGLLTMLALHILVLSQPKFRPRTAVSHLRSSPVPQLSSSPALRPPGKLSYN